MDKRILKNPISGFDGTEAKKCLYLSKKGYFGSCFEDFSDLSKTTFGTLKCFKNGVFSPSENGKEFFYFFLPEDYVSPEPNEEYRPFTLEEFRSKFPLLSPITFREKDTGTVYTQCFLGYTENKDNCYGPFVTLGACEFFLEELFEEYELLDSEDKYVPFGVKDE